MSNFLRSTASPAVGSLLTAANARLQINVPPGKPTQVAGDLLILTIMAEATSLSPALDGWTLITSTPLSTTHIVQAYQRVTDGTEPTALTIALGSPMWAHAIMERYTGVDPVAPIATWAVLPNGFANVIKTPSQNVPVASMVVGVYASLYDSHIANPADTVTSPLKVDRRIYGTGGTSAAPGANKLGTLEIANGTYTAGGVTPQFALTMAGAGVSVGILIALKPAQLDAFTASVSLTHDYVVRDKAGSSAYFIDNTNSIAVLNPVSARNDSRMLMLAAVWVRGLLTQVTAPTGWSMIYRQAVGDIGSKPTSQFVLRVYSKYNNGTTEPASYAWIFDQTTSAGIAAGAYYDYQLGRRVRIDSVVGAATLNSNQIFTGNTTADQNKSRLVAFYGAVDTITPLSYASPMAQVKYAANLTGSILYADGMQTTRGATGDKPLTVAVGTVASVAAGILLTMSAGGEKEFKAAASFSKTTERAMTGRASLYKTVLKTLQATAALSPQRAYKVAAALWSYIDSTQNTGWGYVPDLTRHIPQAMVHGDAEAIPALSLATAYKLSISVLKGQLTIRDTKLVLSGSPVPDITIDLSKISLGGLKTAIEKLSGNKLTVTVVDASARAGVVLIDQDISTDSINPGVLRSWNSGTWRLLYPIAVQVERARQAVDNTLQALDLRTAPCEWLDIWGQVLDLPRIDNEGCEQYRARLMYSMLRTRVNNKSLELLLRDGLGIECKVEEEGSNAGSWAGSGTPGALKKWRGNPGGGTSTMKWAPKPYGQFMVTTPSKGIYSAEQVVAVVQRYKAAGTTFRLVDNSAPQWTFAVQTTDIEVY